MSMVMQMCSQITNKEDARSLSAMEQYERRRQVVRAHERGAKKVQIARELGLSYTAVCLIITRYVNQGADALLPHKRGRRAGEGRALSSEQEVQLQEMIKAKKPRQLQLDFPEWNRPAVAELITKHLGVQMHIRSVTNYLKRWNIVVERAEPRPQHGRLTVAAVPAVLTVPTAPLVVSVAEPASVEESPT